MDLGAFANNPVFAELMQQLAVSEEQKKAAKMQAITQFGLGLLGARKGQEFQRAGQAGQNAMQGYQQGLLGAQTENMNKFRVGQYAQQLTEKQAAAKRQAEEQEQLSGIFSQQQASPLSAMGPGGPTPENAQRVAAAPAVNPQVAQYRQAAAFYAQRGNVDQAKKLSDIADSLEAQSREEYSTTPQVVRGEDGKMKLVQFGKRGGTKVADGMSPAEKLHFANAGGQVGVGLDPYTGQRVSEGVGVTLTPDQIQDHKIAQGNLDVSRGNLGLSRERFGYDKQKDAQSRADAAAGVLKPKNPTEFEAKSALFADQMQSASAVINDLKGKGFSGSGAQQAGLVAAGAGGLMGTLPRAMASKEAQIYNQAADQWSEAYLRVKTGAAATTDEVRKNRATFFPVPGDSAATIARKEIARKEAERAVFGAAGNAAPRVPAAGGGWSITEIK